MPATDLTATPPLPQRIHWFAVWRWKPWKRWLLVAVFLIGYPLSVGPIVWLEAHQRLPQAAMPALQVVYAPLLLLMYSRWDFMLLSRYAEFWERLP